MGKSTYRGNQSLWYFIRGISRQTSPKIGMASDAPIPILNTFNRNLRTKSALTV